MGKANEKTVERVVRAQFFRYTKLVPIPGDPDGKKRPVMATARRGATVSVLEAEAERGDALDAFHPEAAVTKDKETGEAVVEVDVREMTDGDLATWIKEDKPTQKEVIELAEGDAVLAERLLNAERTATNGKVRKTVNKELTAIIDKAQQGPDVEAEGTP